MITRIPDAAEHAVEEADTRVGCGAARAADSCRHPKKDSHDKRFLLARWFSRDHMFSQALRLIAR